MFNYAGGNIGQTLKTASGKTAAVDKIKTHTLWSISKGKKKTHFEAAIKRAERFNPHLHNLSSTSVR